MLIVRRHDDLPDAKVGDVRYTGFSSLITYAARPRRLGLLLMALYVLLTVLATWALWRSLTTHEPTYRGKRLSAWLEVLDPGKARPRGTQTDLEAEEAIRHIGTNAIPQLLRLVRARDTRLKQWLISWAQKQHAIDFHFKLVYQRRAAGCLGFEALGPLGRPAVPGLVNILTSDSLAEARMIAAASLGCIGPDARSAAAALFHATTDTNEWVRNNALCALTSILPDPQLAIPVLIASLDDPLDTARENAAHCLGRYGPQAKAAVPALVRTLSTNRAAAFNLKRIDPDAATKAGIH